MKLLKQRIAVIDSDPVSVYILKKALSAENMLFNILIFRDGSSFYDYIKNNEPPDLCLINMSLDNVSCYNIASFLKKKKETTDIPIIFITDIIDEQIINSIFECGASDYLKMPFNIAELQIRIKTQLKLKQTLFELKNSNFKLQRLNTRYKYELEQARNVQKNIMLDAKIDNNSFGVNYIYQPHFNIGGDYIDIIKLQRDNFAFIIGDMAGHGPTTALKTALLKSFIIANIHIQNSPAFFMQMLNSFLIDNFKNLEFNYLTIFIGFFYNIEKKIVFCSAGQPFPIYYNTKKNNITELKVYGMPLGLSENIKFEEQALFINSGDRLILYTDGLIEIENEDEYLTFDKLKKHLTAKNLINCPLNYLTKELYNFIVSNNKSDEFNDDISAMLIEFK